MPSHHSIDSSEHMAAIRRRASNEAATTSDADMGTAQHPLLNLQRQIGNAQIARMLAQREEKEEEAAEGGAVQAKHDVTVQREEKEEEAAEGGAVQAKHDVTVQREEKEEEAAEGGAVQAKHDVTVQREEKEEEAAEGGAVQAKAEVGLEGGPISADLGSRIQSKRGGGSALDDGTRSSMEGAFGTSFKDVRIHTDGESQQLNRSISAKAFTTGSDIFFGEGASPSDTKLLGHELTHVVQQRSMSTSGPMTVGPAGDHHEQEADAKGAEVASAIESGTAQRQIAREAAEQEEEGTTQRQIAREAAEQEEAA